MLPKRDNELVQIVDAELADAASRAKRADGTSWLACRPGCTPCCHGVFKISMLDAERLRAGLDDLETHEPSRAAAIRDRAKDIVQALGTTFPGDADTGLLGADESAWDAFASLPEADLLCAAIDPSTGTCELYNARPLTCRIFGPPIRSESGVGLCELCYDGADEATILSGQMHLGHIPLEQQLDTDMPTGETVIAWVLGKAILNDAVAESTGMQYRSAD